MAESRIFTVAEAEAMLVAAHIDGGGWLKADGRERATRYAARILAAKAPEPTAVKRMDPDVCETCGRRRADADPPPTGTSLRCWGHAASSIAAPEEARAIDGAEGPIAHPSTEDTGYLEKWRKAFAPGARPVLRTCGECGWYDIHTRAQSRCGRDPNARIAERDSAPPPWCPLRLHTEGTVADLQERTGGEPKRSDGEAARHAVVAVLDALAKLPNDAERRSVLRAVAVLCGWEAPPR